MIRFAQRKDTDQIIELCKLHAEYEKADFVLRNQHETLPYYLFDNKGIINCLVVEQNSELVGYATFTKQFSTWQSAFYLYLDCLFLKEKTRGQGLGRQLMDEVRKFAQENQCDWIEWQTPDFNENAIQFYAKLGATSKTKERFSWSLK